MKAFALLSLLAGALAQGPNTLAYNNPTLRTFAVNETIFVIPIDKALVASVVPYPLLSVPADVLPNFPADKHPVLVNAQYNSDVRMGSLQIVQDMLAGQIYVPFVDRLGDGHSPFISAYRNYIGALNGDDISTLVPAVVGSLDPGVPLSPASFVPNNAAFAAIGGTNPQMYSVLVKQIIVPNPISGPGVLPEAYDMFFQANAAPTISARAFHIMVNQPIILPSANALLNQCQRNTIYFNQTFTDPRFMTGAVQIYPGLLGDNKLTGSYADIEAYSASGVIVGYNQETCADAARNQDPTALA